MIIALVVVWYVFAAAVVERLPGPLTMKRLYLWAISPILFPVLFLFAFIGWLRNSEV